MILYRLILTLAAPAIAAFLVWRVLRGREGWADLRERLGSGSVHPSDGKPAPSPTLWLHAASNGELTAARPLLEEMLRRHPALRFLVTTNTCTGRDMGRGWSLPHTQLRLAPLDYRLCVRRVLAQHRPIGLVVIENELWPNRLRAAHARGLPVALVGARISARSARRWQRAAGLLHPLLAPVALAAPHDAASADALTSLGLSASALTAPVTLKATVALPEPDPADVAALGFVRADTLLAASTHTGEEAQVLDAFRAALLSRPDLRLILAPRHPSRAAEIAALITSAGLRFATRSVGEAPGDAPVYLADTLGEMPLWYAAAGTCFVGGSLVEKGGHTPFEPARFGCAILTGPSVENAADAFARLQAADAVTTVADADALCAALIALGRDAQPAAGARARAALAAGDIAPLAARLSRTFGLRREDGPARRPA